MVSKTSICLGKNRSPQDPPQKLTPINVLIHLLNLKILLHISRELRSFSAVKHGEYICEKQNTYSYPQM